MKKQNISNKLFKFFSKNKLNQSLLIVIVVFLIVLIVSSVVTKNSNNNYNKIKINKDKYLVYEKYNSGDEKFPKIIPMVNINSESGKAINDDINKLISNFINIEQCVIKYEYDINGIILSVVIKIIDYESEETGPKAYFRTYNINLEDGTALSNKAILSFYELESEQLVEEKIKEKFQEHYAIESKEGYIEYNLCDFDCYIEIRGFSSYLEDVSYYIKEGKLYAYKPFSFYSIYGEEAYFTEEDFAFLIKETP